MLLFQISKVQKQPTHSETSIKVFNDGYRNKGEFEIIYQYWFEQTTCFYHQNCYFVVKQYQKTTLISMMTPKQRQAMDLSLQLENRRIQQLNRNQQNKMFITPLVQPLQPNPYYTPSQMTDCIPNQPCKLDSQLNAQERAALDYRTQEWNNRPNQVYTGNSAYENQFTQPGPYYHPSQLANNQQPNTTGYQAPVADKYRPNWKY